MSATVSQSNKKGQAQGLRQRLEEILSRYRELEQLLVDPAVASDPARMAQVTREHGQLSRVARKYQEYLRLTKQAQEARQILEQEKDAELRGYAESELERLQQERKRIWADLTRELAGGDICHANSLIMEIRAGTGGDEAALFARDLFNMYQKYAHRKGWKVEVLSVSPNDLGGFKEIIFSVSGEGVYQHLQFESGGHRVQRVPETEAQGRIHTSAATVAVLPEPDEIEVEIREEDLKIETMRSGGPGGQHQNKTESGVRVTHLPTGIVVNCRDEKSQHKNRAKALRVLRSRLYELQRRKHEEERADQRRSQIGTGDRSDRIRTYNFPQNRVTDHRIGLNLYKLDSIMEGDLDELIDALSVPSPEDELPPL
jgi:peptide chain release factor 1